MKVGNQPEREQHFVVANVRVVEPLRPQLNYQLPVDTMDV